MRILVTGHRGHVGGPVASHLKSLGHGIEGFDLADGDDLLDLAAVRRAVDGCAAIVHLGALARDTAGSQERIMAVNVLGTWHVLLAAEAAAVERVICFSSAQVFGTAGGERRPDYLPIDDDHPRRATRAYGLSKCLAEDLCAGFTTRTGITTVSLRPVWVWDPGMYQVIEEQWRADPGSEWTPFWEYGGFVDVRDVAIAVQRALTVPVSGHHRLLLCAEDIAATEPALAMVARVTPEVPVRDPARYQRDPWRALVDCSAAARVLGWRPQYTWARQGQDTSRAALLPTLGSAQAGLPGVSSLRFTTGLFRLFLPVAWLGVAAVSRVLVAAAAGVQHVTGGTRTQPPPYQRRSLPLRGSPTLVLATSVIK